jgi:hypothetical protein
MILSYFLVVIFTSISGDTKKSENSDAKTQEEMVIIAQQIFFFLAIFEIWSLVSL